LRRLGKRLASAVKRGGSITKGGQGDRAARPLGGDGGSGAAADKIITIDFIKP
jgi:hypothetical protein